MKFAASTVCRDSGTSSPTSALTVPVVRLGVLGKRLVCTRVPMEERHAEATMFAASDSAAAADDDSGPDTPGRASSRWPRRVASPSRSTHHSRPLNSPSMPKVAA